MVCLLRRNLIQALEHGLELKHVHNILSFRQKPWLKSYIDMNSELRRKATNKFESDCPKLTVSVIVFLLLFLSHIFYSRPIPFTAKLWRTCGTTVIIDW